ncbi:hypothetical protein D0962_00970 [Leptolyngbyaceae cyanobacterium CCMR0082]|uniref:Uncharacterized protein n=2 Tax=Adonisia turfae TaxID=2950184 RepID=A0A6M0RYX7_9CYAN|nr:hypothetical protein [Adonisia turfae CCMR0081]NEZ61356.1 hypothetical protein [Adonisia turfae CCMR0082]
MPIIKLSQPATAQLQLQLPWLEANCLVAEYCHLTVAHGHCAEPSLLPTESSRIGGQQDHR